MLSVILLVVTFFIIMLSDVILNVESHYAECRFAECRGTNHDNLSKTKFVLLIFIAMFARSNASPWPEQITAVANVINTLRV